jgi:hypothetical protein
MRATLAASYFVSHRLTATGHRHEAATTRGDAQQTTCQGRRPCVHTIYRRADLRLAPPLSMEYDTADLIVLRTRDA